MLAAFTEESAKLLKELDNIPESMTRDCSIDGNISACDVLAYQIGWGRLLIGWYEAGKVGINPTLPAEGFKWNQLGELAKHFYEVHKNDTIEQLIQQFQSNFRDIETIINENSNDQLYKLNVYIWTGIWPLGRWINVNTSSPYKSARAKIRKWKKLKGII